MKAFKNWQSENCEEFKKWNLVSLVQKWQWNFDENCFIRSWQFHFSCIYDFQLKFNQQFLVDVISTLLCECMDFPGGFGSKNYNVQSQRNSEEKGIQYRW
jgi:hypothetical protein